MITGGRVSFRRVVQPAPYEAAEAMVELSFAIEEGTGGWDAGEITAKTMAQAKEQALTAVGKKAPTQPDETKADWDDDEPKTAKGRGRPKGSKNKPKEDPPAPKDDGDIMGDTTEMEAEEEETTETLTLADCQQAAKAAASRTSGATVRDYMDETFKVKKLSDIPEDKFAAFIKGVGELGA